MRHSAMFALWALFSLGSAAQAEFGQRQPTVVYEGARTIPAWPYFNRLADNRSNSTGDLAIPEGTLHLVLEDRLPLTTDLLSVAQPQMKAIPGLVTPLFVMGMDELSLRWFVQAAPGLAEEGARGIVVQAASKSAWLELQGRARDAGIDLMLLEGDAIAQGYGISTYPTVLVDSALVGEVAHE